MSEYEAVQKKLLNDRRTWLITGVAGFIGSNLLEALLRLNQNVIGLDNFSTGYQRNLDEVQSLVTPEQWCRFQFIEGSICDLEACRQACDGVDVVLHQAALGSVPRSIEDPIATNAVNIDGFLNMLVAARDAGADRFVYAASSSTYGDHPDLPKVEDKVGNPLSPYAVTKLANELYAKVFASTYELSVVGLRYFNVFGKRQDPDGSYAAVIPKWFSGVIRGQDVFINGDGETSRDFCFIDDCVQANLLAATTDNGDATSQVYNVAYGQRTTLNELFNYIRDIVAKAFPTGHIAEPTYRDFRAGDIRHSLADIGKARGLLGYQPAFPVPLALEVAANWYMAEAESPKKTGGQKNQ